MTRSHPTANASIPSQPAHTRRPLLRLLALVELWLERRRQRHALLALNEHMLKDIGLNHTDAMHEGFKPFWRA